jgi:NAD-dependent deacetylase
MAPSVIPAGLVEALAAARHVMVLTGAGVSAESGVPTFREAQTGLWSRFRPEELATVEAFEADPDTVWSWYEWRRDLVARAEPNPGHRALARLERRLPQLTLVTQNVDGLHRRAGSRDPVEFHGNLFDNRCLACGRPASDVPRPCPVPPRCTACGGRVRPGVVWFGEAIPGAALERSFAAAAECDLFLSVGTSSQVYPAAGLAAVAGRNGATVVEVNPQPTALAPEADFALAAAAGVVLPALCEALERAGAGAGDAR